MAGSGIRPSDRWFMRGPARRSRSSKCVLRLDLTPDLLPADYVLLAIDLGDLAVEELTDLPTDPAASGDAWLANQRTAVLQVPSIIVLESSNLLLNSRHPDAGQIRIARR
jgi:RES domain-containing protein